MSVQKSHYSTLFPGVYSILNCHPWFSDVDLELNLLLLNRLVQNNLVPDTRKVYFSLWIGASILIHIVSLQLLTSSAVHKWGTEIHEGIYNMLMLLVDLVAERVKQDPIPVGLLAVLTMVL